MPAPKPQAVKMYQVKEKLLRPALTSNFQCWVPRTGIGQVDQYYDGELLSLSCFETALPGASLMTNETTDDFTGITERFAYRKSYDQTIDLNFYVDHRDTQGYKIILFFETWMRYITNDENLNLQGFSYRVRFPEEYRRDIYLTKFERDFRGNILEYTFINSYPISMSSMPVSYQNSDILRCRVSFSYDRYIINEGSRFVESEPRQSTANGIPEPQRGQTSRFIPRTGQSLGNQQGVTLTQPLPGNVNPRIVG